MTITLIDARAESLTISWPASGAQETKYRLEYKSGQGNFILLSDKLSQPQARKRNLTPGSEYWFRVRAVDDDAAGPWILHEVPFVCLTTEADAESLEAPEIRHPGLNQSLHVSWNSSGNAKCELQMRENEGGAEWKTIARSLARPEVKKKNLASPKGYQFRVRPNKDDGEDIPFSPPSDVVVARGLSAGIQRFFQSLESGTLLRHGESKPVPLADALGGKEFVLLYASAHWCPPCRQFTPMLAKFYKSRNNYLAGGGKAAEIVFLSCDHDEDGFSSYFQQSHPWMAVDFEDDAREQLLAAIRVQGIPRLVVLSGKTGRILVDNAVGQPLDVHHWRALEKGNATSKACNTGCCGT